MTHVFEKRSDGSYVVVRHLESWDVSAAEGVRQLLRAGPPGPLAPVPKKKKETSRLGTQDPIAGPLVAIARKFGVLAAEEPDGWTGEPSEWADADSLTQTFSALAQKYGAGFKLFVAERVAGDYDKALVETRLDAAIAGNGLVMFSFTSCPFCKKAKEALVRSPRRARDTYLFRSRDLRVGSSCSALLSLSSYVCSRVFTGRERRKVRGLRARRGRGRRRARRPRFSVE